MNLSRCGPPPQIPHQSQYNPPPPPPPPPQILHRSHLIYRRCRWLGTTSRFPQLILGLYEGSLPRRRRSRPDKKLSRCRWPCSGPAPSGSPWKHRSPRSISIVDAGNDYNMKIEDAHGVGDEVQSDRDENVTRHCDRRPHVLC